MAGRLAMPSGKKRGRHVTKPSKGGGKKKLSAGDSTFDDRTDFFLTEEDDSRTNDVSNSEDEDEIVETAEEKRLRLAKSYLERVKQQAEEFESGDEDAGEIEDDVHRSSEGAQDALRDRISSRLQQEFMQGAGYLVRRIAATIRVPEVVESSSSLYGSGRMMRGHRLSVTALALTTDDATAYSVAKEGSLFRWDIETGNKTRMSLPDLDSKAAARSGPDWVVQQGKRESGARKSLLAAAVSTDGRYFAAGGGSGSIHVWDTRTNDHIKSLRSHKDAITGLAFREGEATLYSASFDRSVKIWSLSEMAYVDTLYGHQSEVLAIDARRAERCVSTGNDQTCRVWKIPEESQLVFRCHVPSVDCCRYLTTSDWMTGATDGSLSVWNPMRKKAVFTLKDAHGLAPSEVPDPILESVGKAAGWVQSVACAWGTDLAASGAGDGKLRLWEVIDGKHGKMLKENGSLPARGFVNGLALARSGRFVLAGIGQEPRLGRWARDSRAKNGVLLHRLEVQEDAQE